MKAISLLAMMTTAFYASVSYADFGLTKAYPNLLGKKYELLQDVTVADKVESTVDNLTKECKIIIQNENCIKYNTRGLGDCREYTLPRGTELTITYTPSVDTFTNKAFDITGQTSVALTYKIPNPSEGQSTGVISLLCHTQHGNHVTAVNFAVKPSSLLRKAKAYIAPLPE